MANISKKEKKEKKPLITPQIIQPKELTEKEKELKAMEELKEYDKKSVLFAKKIEERIKEYKAKHPFVLDDGLWFTLSQLKTATNLSFDQAQQYIELLSKYGLVNQEERTGKSIKAKQTKFLIQLNTEERLSNIDAVMLNFINLIAGFQEQILFLQSLKSSLKEETKTDLKEEKHFEIVKE